LEARTGRDTFRLMEVVEEVRGHTGEFTENTIRTYMTSVMCEDAPVHHTNHTNDLKRVQPGRYALASRARVGMPSRPIPETPKDEEPAVSGEHPWHWEGNVQAAVVSGLVAEGWSILAVADTASRAAGTDVIAVRDAVR